MERAGRVWLEPITVLGALSVSTSRIGLISTASTTYSEPFNLARQFASIDHMRGGRAGWNIVTSWSARAARNYGDASQVSHAERYARAEEYMKVAKGLWDSWAADAVRDDLRARLAEIVAGSGTSGSLGPLRFAAVLDATATDAETAVAALRESLRSNRPGLVENASVAAGVTELVASDDPGTVLARAERAVEQAKLGGDGTVVVATVNGAGGDA